ncbi:diguanylate cyclase [Klebsiella pneumoniae]|uniref:Diguanylate cyclase n=1 Tax=Klebsiella pneumoniae TaxID=573 RepID=A0A447RGJ6_KLEPN|nr:diguanylate cyclase [Klebsiella pneumoniae]
MVLYNIRLMLCIIHDITEEVHLKKELEFSAAHDPLTGLLNRREFTVWLRRQLLSPGVIVCC